MKAEVQVLFTVETQDLDARLVSLWHMMDDRFDIRWPWSVLEEIGNDVLLTNSFVPFLMRSTWKVTGSTDEKLKVLHVDDRNSIGLQYTPQRCRYIGKEFPVGYVCLYLGMLAILRRCFDG